MLSLERPWALALLALLALVAVLYFLRMRFRSQPVGSVFIWRLFIGKNEGGKKVRRKSILLLALQLMAVAFAVFALASPSLFSSRPPESGIVYLVDVSASMGAENQGGESRVAEAARLALVDARLAAEEARSAGGPRPFAAFACSNGAVSLMKPSKDPGALASALRKLASGDAALDEEAVARDLSAWLAARPESWEARVYSDGGWSLGGERARAVFRDAIRSTAVGERVGDSGVHGLRLEPLGDGVSEASFMIVNSRDEERPYRAALSLEDAEIGTASGIAGPGSTSVSMKIKDDVSFGGYAIRLVDQDDGFLADDAAYHSVGPEARARVLASAALGTYFKAAFAGAGAEVSEIERGAALKAGDCDLAAFPFEALSSNPPCNALFLIDQAFAGVRAEGPVIGAEPGHPLSRFVRWDGMPLEAAFAIEVPAGARALALSRGETVVAAWEEGGYKRIAFGFDPGDSRVGLSPAFPLFVRNLLEWCAPGAGGEGAYDLVVGLSEERSGAATLKAGAGSALEIEAGDGTSYVLAKERGLHAATLAGDSRRAVTVAANIPASELDLAPKALVMPAAPARLSAGPRRATLPLDAAAAAALALVLALEWFLWRGAGGLGRKREGGGGMRSRLMAFLGGLRIAAIVLAVAALLGIKLPLPGKGRSVVLLIDASASVGAEGTEAARDAALRLLRRLERRDRAAVIAFSGDARLVARLSSPREASRILESADLGSGDGSETDIALAVGTAASLLSGAGGNRSVYLFSDGRSTRGEGILPPRFARSGIPLHAYPVGAAAQGIAVEGFELPEVLRSGERAEASWLLRSEGRGKIEWTLSVDGAAAVAGSAELSEGLNGISLPLPPALPGTHELKVEARDANGDPVEAASSGGVISVSGPAEILVASGGAFPSPIAAALRAQGMEARAVRVEGLPEEASGYSGVQAVVLDDVNALFVSEAQQERLLSYVAGGGGLLVVGGDQSFGRGEYFATPLEDLLPVSTDTRRRLFFTRARILFVIDTSGSMSEMVNGVSKQSAALRGVADSLPDLDPLDEVGILGFDDTPEWLIRFTPAGDKETILEAMTRMRGGGGTDLAKAVEEVVKGFGETGPTRKHAVILTDGLTLEADFEKLSRSLSAVGASVTTVGVGETVNEDLLRKIAEWNDGAYYRAEQDQIPRVLVEETVRVSRDLINEGYFTLRESSPSPASAGIAGIAPRVSGYLVTRIKPLARVHLGVDPDQGSRKPGEAAGALDPLLASWRYGAGKVAAFTSDSGSAWLSSWSGKSVYARLWSQILRDVERGDPDSGMLARAYEEGGALRIVVEAVDAEGRAASGLDLQGRGSSAASAPFSLRQAAPGRYVALVPASARGTEPGVERYAIRDARTGAWTEAWTWNPRDAELARTGPDEAALAAASSSTGGGLSPADGPFPGRPEVSVRMTPVRWWALLLSLIVFTLELYGRSTLFGQFKMARATATAWWSKQRTLADRLRDGLPEATRTADDSAKVMDAYRRLAERSLARSQREKEREG